MTKETIQKLYDHFFFLSKGKFRASDFNKDDGDKEKGRMIVGHLPSDRVTLIVSDAKRNLLEMEKKYSFLKKVDAESEPKPIKEDKELKVKGKK